MKKITFFFSALLFSMMTMAQTVVTFGPNDFLNQGTSGTGSLVEATKDGVTVTCDKGYGNSYALRCYKEGVVTISATQTIASLEFAFDTYNDRYYNGDLAETYTVGDNTWTVTLTNQARFTSIKVTLGEGGDNPGTGDNPGVGTPEEVTISGLDYAMAFYEEMEGFAYWEVQLFNIDEAGENVAFPLVMVAMEAKSKTALNGTYDMLLALYGTGEDAEGYVEGVYMAEGTTATLTVKNIGNEGIYSFVGTFVGEDGKTYKLNTESYMMWVEDGATGEEIVLQEEGTNTGDNNGNTDTPVAGAITFDADVDKGNATETRAAYEVAKDGITMSVTDGRLGTYNNEVHYRIYKSATMTLTSTVGNIVSVEFTCTGNDDEDYGPAHFTVDSGNYTYAGAMGTWTGNASTVVFTATTAQVRASQIVVKVATGTGLEDVTTIEIPVKVMQNGQVMIIRGENTYNVLGAQVK